MAKSKVCPECQAEFHDSDAFWSHRYSAHKPEPVPTPAPPVVTPRPESTSTGLTSGDTNLPLILTLILGGFIAAMIGFGVAQHLLDKKDIALAGGEPPPGDGGVYFGAALGGLGLLVSEIGVVALAVSIGTKNTVRRLDALLAAGGRGDSS